MFPLILLKVHTQQVQRFFFLIHYKLFLTPIFFLAGYYLPNLYSLLSFSWYTQNSCVTVFTNPFVQIFIKPDDHLRPFNIRHFVRNNFCFQAISTRLKNETSFSIHRCCSNDLVRFLLEQFWFGCFGLQWRTTAWLFLLPDIASCRPKLVNENMAFE